MQQQQLLNPQPTRILNQLQACAVVFKGTFCGDVRPQQKAKL